MLITGCTGVIYNVTPGVDLRRGDFTGVDFGGLDLRDAFFWRADLTSANLRGANLTDTSFEGATLHRADFGETDLQRTTFHYADLTRANLRGANLKRVNMQGADVTFCDFTGANLRGTTFWNVSGASVCGRVRSLGEVDGYVVVYIDNDRIQVGCQQHSRARWATMLEAECRRLDGTKAALWARRHRAAILSDER